MYLIKRKILRWLFRLLRKTPTDMPTVQYWKTKESVAAKVTKNKDGAIIMQMDGERYPFPGFPRGHLLFGPLSKLKHDIKNKLFNDVWAMLEDGKPHTDIMTSFRESIREIASRAGVFKFDMLPPERMVAPIRELWRAWTVLEERETEERKDFLRDLKKILTFILQEDDAYRFRAQWIIQYFNPSAWWAIFTDPISDFEIALEELERAEIIGDMQERIRLLRRILLTVLQDERIQKLFRDLCKEMDWNKFKLTEADKFHFRGKWFRVDLDYFEY